ncbi:peptidoglycan recognition protein family protein [Desertibacillus haloalkaliphilus]|uniref:peptidoglycan recognition protein family protein n=1 Tax=Desertibacillus haloalkaliphilus TaxID=1328930 RepID=UPI001C26CED2|nr:N-acetylmuramoyl-L-alanine amidase [Desertibacillus haloalkaliphilus]MBU8906763.1 N-acetylmuramoyl-L-alanine amidase [Desertibacillus haloalkaliphilus]
MEIIDKRNQLTQNRNRSYRQRSRNAIQNIAIHHSATTSGSAEAFARYHVNNLGWPGIGYHYVVDKDGTINWCHNAEVVSYHVGNSNGRAVGICMVGDFTQQSLGEAQRNATLDLTLMLMDQLNISVENVWGHIEFPGYEWKQCPSINMENFRRELAERAGEDISGSYRSPNYVAGVRQRNYLSRGDQGDDVLALQERLNELGFKPGPIDGIFGPQTYDAVQRFQRSAGIGVDGIVGPETRTALSNYEGNGNDEEIEHASPTDEPDESEERFNSESRRMLRHIRPMMRGEDVREVQQKVGAMVDGVFGNETEQKVREFQRQHGLSVDGIVGPQTWRALDRVNGDNQPSYQRLLSLQSPYMRGDDVKRVQRELNVAVDGLYGPVTERAVRNFQRQEGISVDGIVGPHTWSRLFPGG